MENCHGRWVFPLMKLEVSSWLLEKITTIINVSSTLWEVEYLLEYLGALTYVEGIPLRMSILVMCTMFSLQ